MKHSLFFAAFLLIVFNSCSPKVENSETNSLNVQKTKAGPMAVVTDTNAYRIGLQCGCEFTMKADGADTSNIKYDLSDFGTFIRVHNVKTAPIAPLTKGIHYGWVAIVTVGTVETFRDT